MRRTLRTLGLASLALTLALATSAQAATSLNVSFNTGSDVASEADFGGAAANWVAVTGGSDYNTDPERAFNLNTANASGDTRWTYSSNGGIFDNIGATRGGAILSGGGGGETYAINRTSLSGFSAAAPSRNLSMDLAIRRAGQTYVLGFRSLLTTSDTSVGTALGFYLNTTASNAATDPNTFTLGYVNNGANGVIASGLTLASTTAIEWYNVDAAWTLNATTGKFDMTISLYDIGSQGISPKSLVGSWTVNNLTNDAVKTADALYAGVNGRYRSNTGVQAVDNLTSTVPEPATLGLLVLGGVAGLIRRRK